MMFDWTFYAREAPTLSRKITVAWRKMFRQGVSLQNAQTCANAPSAMEAEAAGGGMISGGQADTESRPGV